MRVSRVQSIVLLRHKSGAAAAIVHRMKKGKLHTQLRNDISVHSQSRLIRVGGRMASQGTGKLIALGATHPRGLGVSRTVGHPIR